MFFKKSALAGLFLIIAAGCSQKVDSDGNLSFGQGNGDGGATPVPTATSTASPIPTITGTPVPIGLGNFTTTPGKSPNGNVDTPNGIFWAGDVIKIDYTVNGTTSGTVDVYYSGDVGVTWKLIPPPDRPLNGSFDWTLPNETIGMDQVGICKGRFKIVIKSTNPTQTIEVKPQGKEFCVDLVPPTITNAIIYPKSNPAYPGDPIKVQPTEPVYIDFTVTDDVGVPPKPAKLFCHKLVGNALHEEEITSNISQSALGSNKYRIVWNVPANTKCVNTSIKVRDLAGRVSESPDMKGIDVGGVLPTTGVKITLKSVEPVKGPDATADAPNGLYRSTDIPVVTWETVGSEEGKVEIYFSENKGNNWSVVKGDLPLNSSSPMNLPQKTVGFDNDQSRKCKGRIKVVVKSTTPLTTKESVYTTDVCVDHFVPKFLNATNYDPEKKNSSADPIIVKAGKGVLFQYRMSDDVGFGPKSVDLYCRLDDGTEKLVGSGLDSTGKTLGALWIVPENTKCKKTILKVTDLAGKTASVELKGVEAIPTPPGGVNVKIEVNPPKGPNSQSDAPIGLYDWKDKPKVKLEGTGSTEGKIDLYYRVRPSLPWILIKANLPLVTTYDWTLPNETIGLDNLGCRGQLMAKITSVNPAATKEVIHSNGFCVDKVNPKVESASIYPKKDPNTSDNPLKIAANDIVVVPYVFSDDVGISPNNRTDFYCKKTANGMPEKVSDNLVETKNGNSGKLEWTVPSGTKCVSTVLKVTDYSGKSTTFNLKGLEADGTIDPPDGSKCKTGINLADADLLGYYCFTKNFDDAGPRKNHLVKGDFNPTFENKPINPVAIKADYAFGKAAYFDGRAFAVAKQLNDFPINDQPRTIMTWIYTDGTSWLPGSPGEPPTNTIANRQSTIFQYGKTFEAKKSFGGELCCREGCKCPVPSAPDSIVNSYGWDVGAHTSPDDVKNLKPGIPAAGWWHYAVTFSGPQAKKLVVYINGQKVTEKSDIPLETILSDLSIGSQEPTWEPNEYGKFLKGRLSHFAFFKRALTSDDIKKEYDDTKPTKCDDDTGGENPNNGDSCRGIKTNVTYLDKALAETRNEVGFGRSFVDTNHATFASGAPDVKTNPKPVFLHNFGVVTRDSSTGFPDYKGDLVKDNGGMKLEENFMLTTVDTSFVMGDLMPSGEYQFAILSDDDAMLEIADPNGMNFKRILSVDQGPPKFYCATEAVSLEKGKSYPIRARYRQGAASGIAMVLLWRKVSNGNLADNDNCSTGGNKYDVDGMYYFNDGKPTDNWKNKVLGNGWKVVTPEHFKFLKKNGDVCLK